ncbi:serine--tRNA ligase [Candidatus Nanohalococcus occultus]|uniref:serine--tRNA ligase n=1 Tax=Candidatus Nanohalococcus occultus TaxID=2978047 RepID=UPI0039E011E7
MLSIELFRENPEKIKESEKRRGKDPETVEKVIELDEKWRSTTQKLQKLQQRRNEVGDEIAEKKRNGENAEELIEEMGEVKDEVSELEEKESELKERRDEARYRVGNILHESVPKGDDEDDNVEVENWEANGKDEDGKLAADILENTRLVETEKAADLAGERAYYLKNELFELNQALINFTMDLLQEKDFIPMQTPYMLKYKPMAAAAELEDFEEQLYKIEDEDKYLIATSEQTLATYHMDELLLPDEFPKKYAGFSTNFRQEAGKHGQQTRGIWRVHQFEKVEQYIFCKPENSWDLHEELLENSKEVFEKLEIPYRVVNVCTGDMNDNAAKKYDIEAWRPPLGEYGEVVSCSNCTDFQARKVNVRIRGSDENTVAHTLNATACATQRTMTALIENHYEDGVIHIPEALQEYMKGKEKIEVS